MRSVARLAQARAQTSSIGYIEVAASARHMSDHAAAANLQAQRGAGRAARRWSVASSPCSSSSAARRGQFGGDPQAAAGLPERLPDVRDARARRARAERRRPLPLSAEKLRGGGQAGRLRRVGRGVGNFYGTRGTRWRRWRGRALGDDLNVEGARQVADNKVGPRARSSTWSADAPRPDASARSARRRSPDREELAAGAELVEILGRCTTVVNDVSPTRTPPCAAAADCRPLRLSSALSCSRAAGAGGARRHARVLAMKLGGAGLSSATLVEEYPSLKPSTFGLPPQVRNLGPLAPLTTLLHLSLARSASA